MAGQAGAADLAVKARPAPVVAPVFSWTGCYVGIHGGGGATRSPFTDAGFFGEGRNFGSGNDTTGSWGNGALAGGQIGCNYQTGVFVMGIEGEGYWSDMKAAKEFTFLFPNGLTETTRNEVRNKYDYTVAGRIGVAYERAFIYGKLGWAWGKFDFNSTSSITEPGLSEAFTLDGSKTLNGPLFGIGVEYAFYNNWTVKGEYNYINYGLSTVGFTQCNSIQGSSDCSLTRFNVSQSNEKHIFKFGVNYLFNAWQTPVVARY